MYRNAWLLVAFPLLLAALSVARPPALPAPSLPPTFDRRAALALADELASLYPDRSPGSPGAIGATQWVSDQLTSFGYTPSISPVKRDRFTATIPGRGRVRLVNLVAEAAGGSARGPVIVVMAHRDNAGTGAGANDNASGTGALIELARAYNPASQVKPNHTIVFLSTDGGVNGGLGAEHFVNHSEYRDRVVGVINLDAVAGKGPPRLEIAGDEPRSPAGALVETAAGRIFDQTGSAPGRTSALGQLIDLGFPFSLYEQAPFVGSRIPAVTLTTSGDRPRQGFSDTPRGLDVVRLGQIGRAAQAIVGSLDQGLDLAQGTSTYLYLGTRLVRGWAIELVLITMLVPFLAAAVDLFARCRRRGIALRPAARALRARLLFWLLVGALFELFAVLGAWPGGAPRPPDPASSAAGNWPVLGLLGFAALCTGCWFVARPPLARRRPVSPEDDLAGHVAALLGLGVLSLFVVATNPFALIFLLPSVHAWLWLPQVRAGAFGARALVLAAGFAGPLLLLGSFAFRFGLGLDAPWYLAELQAIGYIGLLPFAITLGWAAAAAQLVTLTAGRYAPYPSRRERPRGPIREAVRSSVLGTRRLRTTRPPERERRTLEA
jgi:peptidase M28-like protein